MHYKLPRLRIKFTHKYGNSESVTTFMYWLHKAKHTYYWECALIKQEGSAIGHV
jgi:hypothetical protein